MLLNGGSPGFGAAATVGTATLIDDTITGGLTISGASDVTIAGSSTFTGPGPDVIDVTQASTVSVLGSLTLTGTIDITGGALSIAGDIDGSAGVATIIEDDGSLLTAGNVNLSNILIDGGWAIAGGDTVTITADRTTALRGSRGASDATLALASNATLDVEGTLDLSGTIEGGTVAVNDGYAQVNATINGGVVLTGGDVIFTGTSRLGGSSRSTVDLNGHSVTIDGSLALGAVTFENGAIAWPRAARSSRTPSPKQCSTIRSSRTSPRPVRRRCRA